MPVPYANLTNPQTLNLYAMVADDPESFADLNGHDPISAELLAHITKINAYAETFMAQARAFVTSYVAGERAPAGLSSSSQGILNRAWADYHDTSGASLPDMAAAGGALRQNIMAGAAQTLAFQMAVDQSLADLTTWANLSSTTADQIAAAYMDILEPARQDEKDKSKTNKTVETAGEVADKIGPLGGAWGEGAGKALSWGQSSLLSRAMRQGPISGTSTTGRPISWLRPRRRKRPGIALARLRRTATISASAC